MKKGFFPTVMLIMTAAMTAAAQGAMSSTTPGQLHAELVRLLEKNGSYSVGSIDIRLKNVRFSGCRLSFESESILRTDNSVPPPPAGDMRTQGTRPIRPDRKRTTHYSFDMAEINPSEIAERFESGNTETLILPTIDRDDVVEYRLEMHGFPAKSQFVNSVAITVRKKVIVEVKEKLITAIRACQQR